MKASVSEKVMKVEWKVCFFPAKIIKSKQSLPKRFREIVHQKVIKLIASLLHGTVFFETCNEVDFVSVMRNSWMLYLCEGFWFLPVKGSP